jgi:hypothetical protein
LLRGAGGKHLAGSAERLCKARHHRSIYSASETSSSSSALPMVILTNNWPTGSPIEGSPWPLNPQKAPEWAITRRQAVETISRLFRNSTDDGDAIA